MLLKQSTSAIVLVGPVLDASGVAVTTAVIGDFTLTKNGTSAALSGNTISHSHNGHYAITLTTANTDTIGRLTISTNNASYAMPVFRWDICQPTVYDALFSNAVNTTGGLPAATGAISTLAGAVSTFAGGAVASVTAGVTVTTNNDKTGYSLTATTGLGNQTANITGNLSGSVGSVTGAVGSVTGNVGGNVAGSVGSISGVTFPANFASLGINSSGHVLRVVLVDTTTANSDMRGTNNALLAINYTAPDNATIGTINTNLGTVNTNVLSRLAATSYVAPLSASETRGALGLAAANLDTQLDNLPTNTEFNARTLLAADYATSAIQTAIKAVTDKINTGLVLDGAVYQFTVNMLENGPAGAGGGSATLENQELILANLDNVTGAVSAAVARLQLETQITGFPATICRGSDYATTLESEIRLQLLDLEENPITEIGGTPVAEITWLFGFGTDRQPRLVSGACSWDGTTDELVIQLGADDTATTPLGAVTWQIGAQIGELIRWLGGGTTRVVERQFA